MKRIYLIIISLLFMCRLSAQIDLNTNFDILSNQPIDNRTVIDNLSDTTSITWVYEGLCSYVKGLNAFYVYNGNFWKEENKINIVYSIEQLRQISGRDGHSIFLNGYYSGLNYGGGLFFWFPTDLTGRGDDSGISIAASGGGYWIRERQEFRATFYGAVDSTDLATISKKHSGVELQRMLTEAPSGSTVYFDEGKKFVTLTELTPTLYNANENKELHIRGYGSVLFRGNTISTTLIEAETGSQNFVRVADASQFSAGMTCAIVDKTGGDHTSGMVFSSGNNRIISQISGDTIYFSSQWNVYDYPIGATLITSGKMLFFGNSDNSTLKGLNFDGNMNNNTYFYRWENINAVWFSGQDINIEDITIRNAVAEGLLTGHNANITNLVVDSCGGNGIHLGVTNGLRINNSHFYKTNLRGLNPENDDGVGHNDGAISLSNECFDITVSNTFADNCSRYIGGFQDNSQDRNVFIYGATGKDLSGVIDAATTTDIGAQNIVFDGGVFENCDAFSITNTNNNDSLGYSAIRLSNIRFIGTRLNFNGCKNVSISDCEVNRDGDFSQIAVNITNSSIVKLKDVDVIGGSMNFYASNLDTAIISGDFRDANTFGISTSETSNSYVEIKDSKISTTKGTSSYEGARLGNNQAMKNCIIEISGLATYGVLMPNGGSPFGGGGTQGAILDNCTITTPTGIPTFKIYGGAYNNTVSNCRLSEAGANGASSTNYDINNIIVNSSLMISKNLAVGIGINIPNSGAILQLESSTKGFIPPRMTNAQRAAISGGLNGMLLYSDTDNRLNLLSPFGYENIVTDRLLIGNVSLNNVSGADSGVADTAAGVAGVTSGKPYTWTDSNGGTFLMIKN